MKNSIAVTNTSTARGTGGTTTAVKWLSTYWLSTMYVVLTSFGAGVAALLHAATLFNLVQRLGYPPHFIVLLGIWEVLGAIALSVPGYPLLKEWAYAGMFINFSGAIVAHASVGDSVGAFIGPLLSMSALLVSWRLRPQSRRLPGCGIAGRHPTPATALLSHRDGFAGHTYGTAQGDSSMNTVAYVFKILIRVCGGGALILGLAFWLGYGRSFTRLHMELGIAVVVSLWVLAGIGWRNGARPSMVAFAAGWGALTWVVGITQARLLPGSLHWVVAAVHLLIGVTSIYVGSRLFAVGSLPRAQSRTRSIA